jgi:hypothetical protein
MIGSPLTTVVTGAGVRVHRGPVNVVYCTESLRLIRIPEPIQN